MGHRQDRAASWMAAFCVIWLLTAFVEPAAGATPFGEWVTTGSSFGSSAGNVLPVELPDAPPLLFGFRTGEVQQYRPETGDWTKNGRLQALFGAGGGTATLLPSGVVLVAGGGRFDTPQIFPTNAAELYDPATGTSRFTGSMNVARFDHKATLLASGHVLVSGGMDASTLLVAPTEIYDPATGTWTVAGALNQPRAGHAAVRLANGKVLVAGGSERFGEHPFASAEVFDPTTGVWTLVAAMDRSRLNVAGVALVDGRVLVAGQSPLGVDSQIYDPATDTWTPSVTVTSSNFAAGLARLRDGTPLLLFGNCPPQQVVCDVNGAAVFDLGTASWIPTGPVFQSFHGVVQLGAVLPDGRVLFVDGGLPVTLLFRPDNITPRLAVSLLSIDFGRVDVGQAADRIVNIENAGGATLTGTVTAVTPATPFSVVSGSPFTLAPGASAAVVVRFAPPRLQIFTGIVQFASNGNWVSVFVTGVSSDRARLSGRVVDAGGAGVEGVTVHVSGTETGDTVTDREGNYQRLVRVNGEYTVTPTSAGLTFAPAMRSVMVGSQDVGGVDFTTPFGNPAAAFVARLYQDVLGRAPDAAGLTGWAGFLHQQCDANGLRAVANGFFDSVEFRRRPVTLSGLVTGLYRALLAREPEAAGLEYWVDVLRQDRLVLAKSLVESADFGKLLPDRKDRLAVKTAVDWFYGVFASRVPAPSESAGWIDYIVATGDVEGAVAVFVTSTEFEQRAETFGDTVLLLYDGILRRGPDLTGLDYWAAVLQSSLLSVNDRFLSSTEFQARIPSLCGT
jgi:hypothetical protein